MKDPEPAEPRGVSTAGGRILLIDDDAATCETLRDILGLRGLQVETAGRGAQGLEMLQAQLFAAAVVDIRLPDVSGLDLLRAIKASSPDTEVICITGYASVATAIQALDGAAFGYLIKPFDPGQLLTTIDRALERQRLTRTLRESEERYRLIIEHINDAIFLLDREGRLVFANRRAEQITGYSAAEFLDRPLDALLTPDAAREGRARLAADLAGRDVSPFFEAELARKDATRVWVEANFARVTRDGHAIGYLGVARDATERKRAEAALRASETRYRLAIRATRDAIWDWDLVAGRVEWSENLQTLFGHLPAEAGPAGTWWSDLIHPEDRQPAVASIRSVLDGEGELWSAEYRFRRRDGVYATVVDRGYVVRDGAGKPLRMIGAMQDVTERTHAEATLRQNERLAAMGQLLAGVAHELNNPLSVVIGHATLLREMAGGGPFAERVRKIAEAAERTARIVRNFLAMARQRPPERRRVRLNQIVQDAVELLAYALRVDGVEVSLDLAPDMPDLWADAHQLHQVLVNLLVNAHQAMRQTPEPRQLSLTTRSDPAAGRVWLEVADTGPGVSASIEPRLFEPFFTTKPPGQGTGLGLSLCRGVVESHGGSIQLQRRPGSGAVFRVELPVSVPVPATRAADGAGGPSTLRGLRVLAVDDEPDILDILDDLLARDGHRVDRAANGRAALDRLRAATYDLIVSDVRMPEMDGPALYRELERHVPPMTRRFIFVTGDALTPETEEFVQRTEVPTVGKPFDADEIRKVVQRTIAAAGGRIAR